MNITLLTAYCIDKIIKSPNTIIYFDLYDDNYLKLLISYTYMKFYYPSPRLKD